jgi:AraC family transcriptional regulator of adaptative response/methylated-DNA-[protein]-cysteine methyltransferase
MMKTAMPAPPREPASRYESDDERWRAVLRHDAEADGRFVYAVRTTGVYCRPSCAARRPRRENIEFHRTPREAERMGFRACRRCRPRDSSPHSAHAGAVSKACATIAAARAGQPPDLRSLARTAGMSPSHFRRVFRALTGMTPKAYSVAHRTQRARDALSRRGRVTSAIYDAGFNSSARFYETASATLGMTPTAFRDGGTGETIRFAVGECSLGAVLVAATGRGVCSIALGDDPNALVHGLERRFPKAKIVGGDRGFERLVARVIALVEAPAAAGTADDQLPLDVRGTAFQHRVWQSLRTIPCGETRTYSDIARALGAPGATRAVAGACAANPVAVAIPCHRVVRTDGSMSGYRWGVERKAALLERERASAGG